MSNARPYHSPLREQQAAATRDRVLRSAGELFGDRGYAGTTLPAIADRADVSVETVKAMGPKWSLMHAAYEVAFRGQEGDHPVEDDLDARTAEGPVGAEDLLAGVLDFVIDGNQRSSRLWVAFQAAAAADEALQSALNEVIRRRDESLVFTVGAFAQRGWEPTHDRTATALSLGYLVAPESHIHFVLRGGWSVEQYRAWLDSAVRSLFDLTRSSTAGARGPRP